LPSSSARIQAHQVAHMERPQSRRGTAPSFKPRFHHAPMRALIQGFWPAFWRALNQANPGALNQAIRPFRLMPPRLLSRPHSSRIDRPHRAPPFKRSRLRKIPQALSREVAFFWSLLPGLLQPRLGR
jgi:hypothetical protein